MHFYNDNKFFRGKQEILSSAPCDAPFRVLVKPFFLPIVLFFFNGSLPKGVSLD
jgi:hypothetical protein